MLGVNRAVADWLRTAVPASGHGRVAALRGDRCEAARIVDPAGAMEGGVENGVETAASDGLGLWKDDRALRLDAASGSLVLGGQDRLTTAEGPTRGRRARPRREG